MEKKKYMIPLLRFLPVRSEESFLTSTGGNIGDWEKDPEPIDF